MILSHLVIPLRAGARDDLVAVFHRHRILETAIEVPGCRRLYLATAPSRSADPGSAAECAHVVGVWDDAAGYQRWLDHPERGAANDDLRNLRAGADDEIAAGELWTVHHTVVQDDLDDHALDDHAVDRPAGDGTAS